MERSASEPEVSQRRKFKKLPTVRAPDEWQHGWISHPLCSSGPRWTVGKEGLQSDSSLRSAKGGSHKDRNTWIQALVREKTWVPGPGSYRTEREFQRRKQPKEATLDDEVDTNLTIQEAAPNYSFEKERKETNIPLKDLKPRRNNGSYPTLEPRYNPGPGSYTCYTYMGCASGGSRKAWLGGTATHGYETMQKYPVKFGSEVRTRS